MAGIASEPRLTPAGELSRFGSHVQLVGRFGVPCGVRLELPGVAMLSVQYAVAAMNAMGAGGWVPPQAVPEDICSSVCG